MLKEALERERERDPRRSEDRSEISSFFKKIPLSKFKILKF